MTKLEEINSMPKFSRQTENKILFSNHSDDISVSYESTYTLKYIIEGVKKYNFKNRDLNLSKSQYLILNNNSKITTEASKGTKGLSLFFSPELINDVSSFYTNQKHTFEFFETPMIESKFNIDGLLKRIVFIYEENKDDFKIQLNDLHLGVLELIVQEQNWMRGNFSNLGIVKQETKKEIFKQITATKDYLHDNFDKNISLDSISKDIGLSKFYLHRLFREFNVTTPLEYLTKIRLERAKNKLQYSKDSIFEIAIACGFENTSYFSRTFKRHVGITPSLYRNSF